MSRIRLAAKELLVNSVTSANWCELTRWGNPQFFSRERLDAIPVVTTSAPTTLDPSPRAANAQQPLGMEWYLTRAPMSEAALQWLREEAWI